MKKMTFGIVAVLVMFSLNAEAAPKKKKKKVSEETETTETMAPRRTTKKFSRAYGTAGCGLGSQVIGKEGGFMQVFAATTNGTSMSQYFGITTGTSNCVDDPNDEVAMRLDRFVAGNRVAMAGDIAKGEGETIASLSHLMGCADQAQVGSALQRSFREIFPSHKVDPNQVTDSIITVIQSDSQLASQCKQVISS